MPFDEKHLTRVIEHQKKPAPLDIIPALERSIAVAKSRKRIDSLKAKIAAEEKRRHDLRGDSFHDKPVEVLFQIIASQDLLLEHWRELREREGGR